MKICPHCKRTYENAETRFCPEDGQALAEPTNFAAQSQPQTKAAELRADPNAAPLSASFAVMFFPLAFMPPYQTGRWGYYTNVNQATGAKVDAFDFGEKLITLSLWFLQRNDLMRFALGAPRKKFFSSYTPLIVEINHANPQKIPGLEFDLLETARRSAPGLSVDDLAAAYLTKYKRYFPLEPVYQRMTQWAIHQGYGQPAAPKKKPFFRLGSEEDRDFEFAPDYRRIARVEPSAQAIQRDWIQFQNEQRQLADKIREEVKRAIHRLTLTHDD